MGVNAPLPGQMTVKMLIEALEQEQPNALVAWVDPRNSARPQVLYAIVAVEGGGTPVVKLHSDKMQSR